MIHKKEYEDEVFCTHLQQLVNQGMSFCDIGNSPCNGTCPNRNPKTVKNTVTWTKMGIPKLKRAMTQKELIRQEIERRMKETEDSQFDKGERYGLKTVLEFIDSLPDDHFRERTKMMVEEALIWAGGSAVDAFIAGVEWQKEQDAARRK